MTQSLPKGWRYDRLKDVASLRTEKTKDKSDLADYLELEDIESWSMRILNKRNTLEVESAVTLFNAGDVLFGKLRPYLAKVCRPEFNGKCTGEILAICPCHVDGNYLKYALIDPEMIKKCTEFSYGAKMPRVNWSTQLSTFEISLPPLPEQKRIAAFLDAKCVDIDKAIETKRKQLEGVAVIWQNVLSNIVLGIDRGRKVYTGNYYFPRIPTGWKLERLKKYFSYAKGLNFTKADLVDEGIPVVSYGQIHAKHNYGFHLQEDLIRFIPRSLAEGGERSCLRMGDIVFADTSEDLAGVGNCVLNDKDDMVYAGYHALIAHARFPEHSKYLSALFQTDEWRLQIRQRACGIKVFSLTQRMLSNVVILLPPLSVQEQIMGRLEEHRVYLERLSDNLRRQIEVLADYRKSLIHECVMGERRVV